jgi:hypothetical protein
MNYEKIYKAICKRGKKRHLQEGVIYERHHILPKSLGGKNSSDNIAILTLREHFIAHLLLVEIYPKSKQMRHALWLMCHANPNIRYIRHKPSSRTFERVKSEYIKSLKNIPFSEETKKKMSEAHLGEIKSPEAVAKSAFNRKGAVRSEESRKRMVLAAQLNNSSKAVIQYSKEGVFLRKFSSVNEAAAFSGRDRTSLDDNLKGLKKCRKFIWKYATEA